MTIKTSTKPLIAGLILDIAIIALVWYAAWRPTATSPLPPAVMQTGVIAIFAIGLALILASVVMKITTKIKKERRA